MKWESILKIALKVLERQREYVPYTEWTWGGGSALAYRYRHRDSEDVDIFFWDAQLLPFFSPRVNSDLEEIALRYNEMFHFIKVWTGEGSQIDFILAPSLTEEAFTVEEVMGYRVQVETPWEIATKKLLYRSYDLKVRDVVDVVAVLRHGEDKERLLGSSDIFAGKIEEIRRRLTYLEKEWDRAVERVNVFDESLKNVSIMGELKDFLSEVADRGKRLNRRKRRRPYL